MKGLMVQL
jgi:hypothetical protein